MSKVYYQTALYPGYVNIQKKKPCKRAFVLAETQEKKMVEGDGFEPSKSKTTDLQSAPFGHSGTPPYKLIHTDS